MQVSEVYVNEVWHARSGCPRRRVLVLMPVVCSKTTMGKAVDLLSGPSGLASFLRRRQLGARLGGPSLPLDIGYAETIPAGIRNAVTLRDQHCRWAAASPRPEAGLAFVQCRP